MRQREQFRHMRNISDKFSIREESEDKKTIYWDETKVVELMSTNELKDQEKGQCLLLGSGPSVKDIDYKKVGNKPVFMMNGSIVLADKFKQNRILYVADDFGFICRNMDTIKSAIKESDLIFLNAPGLSHICSVNKMLLKGKKVVLIERVNRFYNVPQMSDKLFYKNNKHNLNYVFAGISLVNRNYNIGFTKNLLNGYFGGRTIPYCALQIAYHLGYRDISMIGVDFTNIGERFYFEQSPEKTKLKENYNRHILPSFKTAKKCSLKDNWELRIINSSSQLLIDGL